MKSKYVTFKSIIRCDNKVYFTAVEMNGLFVLDEKNKSCLYIGKFANEELLQKDLYRGGTLHDQILYFAPFYAKRIGCYDIKENIFFSMDLPEIFKCKVRSGVPKMLGVFSYENTLFFLSRSLPVFVCMDVSTGKTSMISLSKNFYTDEKKDNIFAVKYSRKGNDIYIPRYDQGSVIIFSLESMSVLEVKLQCCSGINDIVYDSERKIFWLITKDNAELLSWDGKTSNVAKFENPFIDNEEIVYTEIVRELNYLYLVSYRNKNCFIFNLEETKFEKIEMKYLKNNYKEEGFYWCGKLADRIWTFRKNTGELISLDGNYKNYKIKCKNTEDIKLSFPCMERQTYESGVLSLDDCFQCVDSLSMKKKIKPRIGIGEKIYYIVKGVSE